MVPSSQILSQLATLDRCDAFWSDLRRGLGEHIFTGCVYTLLLVLIRLLGLLLHQLVQLVAHVHIVLEVPLCFCLRLLQTHRHELFVGLCLVSCTCFLF